MKLKPSGNLKSLGLIPARRWRYQNSLEELVKAGFRMSDEVYLSAVRMGREIK